MTEMNEAEVLNTEPKAATSNPYRRIGGFLIVVAIFLVLNLIHNFLTFLVSLTFVIKKTQWEYFTNPESASYHPYWKTILIADVISNAVIAALTFFTVIAFFRKKRTLPVIVIISIIINFLLIFIGHFYTGLIPAMTETVAYIKEGENMPYRILSLLIWIPYFLLSKRVKGTFVR